MNEKTYYCPHCEMDCPYYDKDTTECHIGNPMEECDDYAEIMGEEEEDEPDRIRFYFNTDLNLCADEDWIVGYMRIQNKTNFASENYYRKMLRKSRCYEGWFECEVSNTIEEGFHDYGMYKFY